MLIGAANPGDVVALDADDGVRVYQVGSLFGVAWRKGARRGTANDVLVNRLDPATLRPIQFADGYAFESGLVAPDLDVEMIATADFMRGLRLRRAVFAAADDGSVDVDPLKRQQSSAAQVAAFEWFADGKDIPF